MRTKLEKIDFTEMASKWVRDTFINAELVSAEIEDGDIYVTTSTDSQPEGLGDQQRANATFE